ncbi:MAG: phage tail protein [Pseudomonadota bacterium]
MMHKTNNGLYAQVVNKGLTMSKYKGVHEAKRIMMRAGLPIDLVNKVLLQDKNINKDVSKLER